MDSTSNNYMIGYLGVSAGAAALGGPIFNALWTLGGCCMSWNHPFAKGMNAKYTTYVAFIFLVHVVLTLTFGGLSIKNSSSTSTPFAIAMFTLASLFFLGFSFMVGGVFFAYKGWIQMSMDVAENNSLSTVYALLMAANMLIIGSLVPNNPRGDSNADTTFVFHWENVTIAGVTQNVTTRTPTHIDNTFHVMELLTRYTDISAIAFVISAMGFSFWGPAHSISNMVWAIGCAAYIIVVGGFYAGGSLAYAGGAAYTHYQATEMIMTIVCSVIATSTIIYLVCSVMMKFGYTHAPGIVETYQAAKRMETNDGEKQSFLPGASDDASTVTTEGLGGLWNRRGRG